MDPEHSDAIWTSGFAIFCMVLFLIVFIPALLTLISIQNTLYVISAENRKMPPNQVWLVLIPVFGIVWQFIVVHRLSESLALEFQKRNIKPDEVRPAFNIGIACCIMLATPYFIFSLITVPIFWVKIDRYRKQLESQSNVLDAEI